MSFITGWASNVGRAYRHRRARSLGLLPPDEMPEYEDNGSSSSRIIDSIAGRFHKDTPADLRRLDSVKAEGDKKLRAKMERGLPAFQERGALPTHDEHEEAEPDQQPDEPQPQQSSDVQQGAYQYVQNTGRESVHSDVGHYYATQYSEDSHSAHTSFAGPSRYHQAPPVQYHPQHSQYTQPVQSQYHSAHFSVPTSTVPDTTLSQYNHQSHAYAPDPASYYPPHNSYLPSHPPSQASQFTHSQNEWSHAPESSDWHTEAAHQQQYASQYSSYYPASASTSNLLAARMYGEPSAMAPPMSSGQYEAPVPAAPARTTPYGNISPADAQYQSYARGLPTPIQPVTTPEHVQALPSRSRPLPTPTPRRASYNDSYTNDPTSYKRPEHSFVLPTTPNTTKVLPARPQTAQASKPTLESKGMPPSRSRPLPTPTPVVTPTSDQNSDSNHTESESTQERPDTPSAAIAPPSAPSTPTHASRLRGPRLPGSSSSPAGTGKRISSYESVPAHVQSNSSTT